MESQYALITGASGGIGLEFANIAASQGMNLILIARSAEKLMRLREELEKTHSIKVLAVGCDLSQPDASEKIVALLKQRNIVPDVLINNAGFGLYGPFEYTDHETEADMMQVNMVTLTELTKIIYKKMRERNQGRILNVSSIAGFIPGPLMAVYYATKAYVLSFSEALANEAKNSNINITVLCPGPTSTNFETTAMAQNSNLFKRFGKLPTGKQVAEYGWHCMMKGKVVAVYGWKNRCMLFFIRFLPRKSITAFVRKIQSPINV
ncbi:MAG: SDR family oxidoreductase [Bacteroidales bacterium]|jgi:short-subunit dehydrogenase|nr:SDR family oxidoreductase [Bacteroidales bacterium]